MDPDPIPIHVAVTVRGDELEVDFAGTAPQVRGAINATGSFAKSAAYACVRGLMGPRHPQQWRLLPTDHVQVPEGQRHQPGPARRRSPPAA